MSADWPRYDVEPLGLAVGSEGLRDFMVETELLESNSGLASRKNTVAV